MSTREQQYEQALQHALGAAQLYRQLALLIRSFDSERRETLKLAADQEARALEILSELLNQEISKA